MISKLYSIEGSQQDAGHKGLSHLAQAVKLDIQHGDAFLLMNGSTELGYD